MKITTYCAIVVVALVVEFLRIGSEMKLPNH